MLEATIVVLVVLATLAAAAAVWTYRRFTRVRARLIERIADRAPEMRVETSTDAGLEVWVLGSRIAVDLAALLRRRPRGLTEAEWFDRLIEELRARVPIPEPPPYPLVADRIVPHLKRSSYVEVFEGYPPAQRLAWRAFAPGIAVTYVLTGFHRWTAVTTRMVEAWGTAPDALHARALANLRAMTARMLAELGGPRRRYEYLDGFDATRILVGEMVVPSDVTEPRLAIPEESVLLVAPASEAAALAAEAADRCRTAASPLSSRVFRLTPDGPAVTE